MVMTPVSAKTAEGTYASDFVMAPAPTSIDIIGTLVQVRRRRDLAQVHHSPRDSPLISLEMLQHLQQKSSQSTSPWPRSSTSPRRNLGIRDPWHLCSHPLPCSIGFATMYTKFSGQHLLHSYRCCLYNISFRTHQNGDGMP